MSDNKHYYYIKLKADYFDTDEMIVLESMTDGHKYSNILLKFMLRSLRNEGKLMFNCKNRAEPDTDVGVRPDAKTEFNRTVKRS